MSQNPFLSSNDASEILADLLSTVSLASEGAGERNGLVTPYYTEQLSFDESYNSVMDLFLSVLDVSLDINSGLIHYSATIYHS